MLAGAGMAMVLAASMLQGCGGSGKQASPDGTKKEADSGKADETKEGADYGKLLEDMKEFTTKDGSVSIKLNKDWGEEDLGLDFWLGVQNAKGDEAVLVMQFPKAGTMQMADSMDSVKTLVNETCLVTEETAAEAPEYDRCHCQHLQGQYGRCDGRRLSHIWRDGLCLLCPDLCGR